MIHNFPTECGTLELTLGCLLRRAVLPRLKRQANTQQVVSATSPQDTAASTLPLLPGGASVATTNAVVVFGLNPEHISSTQDTLVAAGYNPTRSRIPIPTRYSCLTCPEHMYLRLRIPITLNPTRPIRFVTDCNCICIMYNDRVCCIYFYLYVLHKLTDTVTVVIMMIQVWCCNPYSSTVL